MPIGQDALIRIMVHGTRGSVEFSNVEGSFYHFRADFYDQNERREVCSPPDDWGGRAITNWASRLEGGARFDPSVRNVLKCAEVIDIIYGRDRLEMSDGLHLEA
jgi:predicted dehydrogenase